MINKLGIEYVTPEDLQEFFGVCSANAARKRAVQMKLVGIRLKSDKDVRSRYYYPLADNIDKLKGFRELRLK